VIAGWRDSSALVKCNCEVAPLAFSFRGRIVEFNAPIGRVRFLHVDGEEEFVFDLMRDFECWYVEPRDFPDDAKTFVCGVTFVFLSRLGSASAKDFIALSELVTPPEPL
jgi:hypothetical protein